MSRKTSFQLLSIPSYRFFLATRLFLTLALQMQAVIIGWQIYELTNDPFSLGLVGLAEAIPAISIALYAGHIADIHNRKTILLISLAVILFSSIGLFYGFAGHFNGKLQLILIYGFIGLNGLARGFYSPASFATISLLVPKQLLSYASTLNSTIWQFASVIGPALGGFVLPILV
jgi:MFS family permease